MVADNHPNVTLDNQLVAGLWESSANFPAVLHRYCFPGASLVLVVCFVLVPVLAPAPVLVPAPALVLVLEPALVLVLPLVVVDAADAVVAVVLIDVQPRLVSQRPPLLQLPSLDRQGAWVEDLADLDDARPTPRLDRAALLVAVASCKLPGNQVHKDHSHN